MRVLYTPTSGTTTPFVIADDTSSSAFIVNQQANANGAGGLITGDNGFIPDLQFATQKDELIDASYLQELPRGNAQTTWTMEVNRQATTQDIMLAFIADHPALVPLSGTLALYVGNTVRYLKNAVTGSVRCTKQKGTDFSFQYVIRGSYNAPVYGSAGSGTGGPWTTS